MNDITYDLVDFNGEIFEESEYRYGSSSGGNHGYWFCNNNTEIAMMISNSKRIQQWHAIKIVNQLLAGNVFLSNNDNTLSLNWYLIFIYLFASVALFFLCGSLWSLCLLLSFLPSLYFQMMQLFFSFSPYSLVLVHRENAVWLNCLSHCHSSFFYFYRFLIFWWCWVH